MMELSDETKDEIKRLIFRIKSETGESDRYGGTVLERLRKVIPPDAPGVSPPAGYQNIHSLLKIKRTGKIIKIASRQDYASYARDILDLGNLDHVVRQYRNDEYAEGIVKLFTKMIQNTNKKMREVLYSYRGEDNSEKLAEFVRDKILKSHVKKISESLCTKAGKNTLKKTDMIPLIKAMNQYLENLGVYTFTAVIGEAYTGDTQEYYEFEKESEDVGTRPLVLEDLCPAYIVECICDDYEEGEIIKYHTEGKCLIGKG